MFIFVNMLDSLQIDQRRELISDGGPLYHEFIAEAFIKEPWNAFSSLVFFIPVAFWVWKLKGRYKENLIIVALLPMLFLNGVGSTLFHALRTDRIWLFLDFMPAMLMSITLSSYLWTRIVRKWYFGIAIVLGFYFMAFTAIGVLMQFANLQHTAPNLGYLFTGLCYVIPIIIILYKTNGYRWKWVVMSFVFLLLALVCRASDFPTSNPFPNILPQGTHFLWHIFSSFAVFTMGYYVYFINKIDLNDKTTYPRQALKIKRL